MWHDYFKQLEAYLKWQQQKMQSLEQAVNDLQQQYEQLKKKPHTTIEKIEYHFDQLKVETLEGTLNIGLNPATFGEDTIENFAVPKSQTIIPQPTPIFRNIQTAVHSYLQEEGENIIARIEQTYGRSLDSAYREFILQDIVRQIDDRIHFYLRQYGEHEQENDALQQTIISYLKRDIEHSIDTFLKHLPREGTNE
ncbi:spore germination protein PC [Anoxybacillus flavithermus NBRC 109594]|uniref:Spore germination protein PC n=1 Tax=Anoxybacillus flavithermus NBRC 109594 TaxID=1315967 RepID=R4FZJ7_9BACL|nr:spore germination protein GerPC [Anoxybacillus flavithermus]GAC90198.1 spore germination protein PC [Anoxybacillus flavithermus NBRC 109594]